MMELSNPSVHKQGMRSIKLVEADGVAYWQKYSKWIDFIDLYDVLFEKK